MADSPRTDVREHRLGLAGSPITAPAKQVLGDRLGAWTEKGLDRIEDVARRAHRRRPSPLHAVPERLAVGIVQEAAVADNAVVAEYLAGIAAGALGDGSDGALPFLQIVRNLSTAQLRYHYFVFEGFRQAYLEEATELNVFDSAAISGLGVWYPHEAVVAAGLDASVHMLTGLHTAGLIGSFGYHIDESERPFRFAGKNVPPGLFATPQTGGFLLFALLAGLDLGCANVALQSDEEILRHVGAEGGELATSDVSELPDVSSVKRLRDVLYEGGLHVL